jgi:hypothetical protein
MVVGDEFVWMHFPKTAGHTVELALRAATRGRRDIVFDQRGVHDDRWHDSLHERRLRDRSFDPTGKLVIAGFRRLPWWILSRVHYEASRPPYRWARREMIQEGEYFEQSGAVGKADVHATMFADCSVHRWLRTEHLREDFVACFGDILGPAALKAVRKLDRKINETRLRYVERLDFYFTPDELRRLYEANPTWAAVEREVYGGLLGD